MKKYTAILFVLISSILSGNLSACFFHPFDKGLYLKPHGEVVDGAHIIILAEAIDFIPDEKQYYDEYSKHGTYHFKIIETLKGEYSSNLEIRGDRSTYNFSIWEKIRIWWYDHIYTDYEEEFWKENMGRIRTNNSMCALVKYFEVGSTYLLISSDDDDSKHYEEISSKSDKWLLFVRNRLELMPKK